VAFVGRSGAGKSSTIHLIERFFDPTAGHVFLDGHDIRTEDVQTHRARLALVVSTHSYETCHPYHYLTLALVPSQTRSILSNAPKPRNADHKLGARA
jgi:ABC-type multidrug transport system ATPase subunit